MSVFACVSVDERSDHQWCGFCLSLSLSLVLFVSHSLSVCVCVCVCERSVKSGINEVSHTASHCCLLTITTTTWLIFAFLRIQFVHSIRYKCMYNVRCWEFKVWLLLVVVASYSNMWPHTLHCTFSPIRFRLWPQRSMCMCVYVVCLRLLLKQHDNGDERIEILNHSNILVLTSPSVQSKQFVCDCHRVYFNIWQDTRTTRQQK